MNQPFKMIFLLCMLSAATATAQKYKRDSALIHTVDSLYKADQTCAAIRPGDSAAAAFRRVTRSNFPTVKRILDKYGFPGYDLLGKEGSGNYFVLVQHSDFDVAFQQRALKLMKKQVDKKNAPGGSYAYLVDRVNLNTGKQQVYGTQVNMSATGTTLKPCMDTLHLDKRRASVGLSPIRDYLDQCDEVYKQLNPGEAKKENE